MKISTQIYVQKDVVFKQFMTSEYFDLLNIDQGLLSFSKDSVNEMWDNWDSFKRLFYNENYFFEIDQNRVED